MTIGPWFYLLLGAFILVPLIVTGPRRFWGEPYKASDSPVLFWVGLAIALSLIGFGAFRL